MAKCITYVGLDVHKDARRYCRLSKLTRCRVRRADRGAAEPKTQKCQSPPVKVGHEHPAVPGKLKPRK
jgi:hypothetical protein